MGNDLQRRRKADTLQSQGANFQIAGLGLVVAH